MGVKGLWKLLLPIGRRISLETLEGRILAVDASIWLTQFLKAMRDPATGKVHPAAHLTGFVRRLCKLYFHGIRPVFVFDGPTPAIKLREVAERRKKREQFSTLDQASVQRMAKRLLAENLKKQKAQAKSSPKKAPPTSSPPKSSASGSKSAYMPGFNPDVRREAHPSDAKNDDQKESSRAISDVGVSVATAIAIGDQEEGTRIENTSKSTNPMSTGWSKVSQEDEAAIIASIQQDLLEADGNKMDEEEQNDFDAPINVESETEDAAANTEKMEKKDMKHYFNTSRRKRIGNSVVDCGNVAQISTLPSSERKDAIEQAKRQHRLRSRKEYMPAAASPDKFSSVQLSNFLKSSRFNLDVQRMATEQVAAETGESSHTVKRGEENVVMASDRTTRISLIREDDSTSKDMRSTKISEEQKTKTKTLFVKNTATSRSYESDEDSEVEWEDAELEPTVQVSVAGKHPTDREAPEFHEPRVAESAGGFLVPETGLNDESEDGGGFLPTSKADEQVLHSTSKDRASVDPEIDEEEEGEGGFLSTDGFVSKSRVKGVKGSVIVGSTEEDANARMYSLDEDSDEGGLIEANEDARATSKDLIVLNSENDSEPSVGSVALRNEHSKRGQENNDRALAKALQEMEDEEAADILAKDSLADDEKKGASQPDFGTLSDENFASRQDARVVGFLGDKSSSPCEKKSELESSSEDEDVDWEEGDGVQLEDDEVGDQPRQEAPPTCLDEMQTYSSGSSQNIVKLNGGVGNDSVGMRSVAEDFKPSASVAPAQTTRIASESSATVSEFSELFPSESSHGSMLKNAFSESSNPKGDWESEVQSAETAAVLERAQATASSLADWAGRAFRRAMKDANKTTDVPESSSEKDQQDEDIPPASSSFQLEKKPTVEALEHTSNTPAPILTANQQEPKALHLRDQFAPSIKAKRNSQFEEGASTRLFDSKKARGGAEPHEDSHDEAMEITDDLLRQWESERNQRERDADTVTDEMKEETIRLLRMFGVPYIEAPAEAEAQCVALEALGLVDGIVTDDSDVFVFGGKRVYKNIFDEKLFAEAYMADDAEKEMGLTRDALVALSLLLGSDYTSGVKGVGIVNAMEVLQAFDVKSGLKEGLSRFRSWLEGFDPGDNLLKLDSNKEGQRKAEESFHEVHKAARTRWVMPPNFPADTVIQACMNPVVDKSQERFSWGEPDVEGLVIFCAKHIGWPAEDTRKMLEPVVGRRAGRYTQTRLDSFMRYEDGIKFANVRSKRLRSVLQLSSDKPHKKSKNTTDQPEG